MFHTITNRPPSTTKPINIEDPNAPFMNMFSQFITIYLSSEEAMAAEDCPFEYLKSIEFYKIVTDEWHLNGTTAAEAPEIDSLPMIPCAIPETLYPTPSPPSHRCAPLMKKPTPLTPAPL
jgi:hypothetical protein